MSDYSPTDWVDFETPVDAAHLDKMEAGILAADEAADTAQTTADAAQADATAAQAAADAAQVTADAAQPQSEKAQANGYASLDSGGKVPLAQLPEVGAQLTYEGDHVPATSYQDGDVVVKDGIAYLCVGGPTTTPPDIAPWGAAWFPLPDESLPERLRQFGKIVTDWNDAQLNGWYACNPGAANAPVSTWLVGICHNFNTNVVQRVWEFKAATGFRRSWERQRWGTVWQGWYGVGPPEYGTSLPANPVDAQEAVLVDSLTDPSYQWRFRYNAGSSSVYKWEFVGGAPKTFSYDQGGAAMDNGAFKTAGGWYWWENPLGSVFPVPRTGEYAIRCKLRGVNNHGSSAQTAWITAALVNLSTPAINPGGAAFEAAMGILQSYSFTLFTGGVHTAAAGTDGVGMAWKADAPTYLNMHGVWVEITPVSVQ